MSLFARALPLGAVALLALPVPSGAAGSWKTLFDGHSTDAWRGYGRDAFPSGVWKVEGGELKTVPGAKDPVDIITKDTYKDFELELEWKISPGGNSGIIYRVAELPAPSQTWQTGPEMQVLDDDKHKDGKDPRTSAGALYALIAAMNKTLKPVGEWNKVRIVMKAGHVEHWLNGAKVVEYEWGSPELKDLIAASKFKEFPRFAQEAQGHVALQFHGDEVAFRNVRIRSLDTK
jgi:hypothetical protein